MSVRLVESLPITAILQSVLLILPENIDALKRTNLPYRVDLNTECQMLNQLNNFFLPSYYSKLVTIREYKRQFEAEYTMNVACLINLMSHVSSALQYIVNICQTIKMEEDQLISHVVTDNVHANEYILERIQDTWNELLKMVDRLLNY